MSLEAHALRSAPADTRPDSLTHTSVERELGAEPRTETGPSANDPQTRLTPGTVIPDTRLRPHLNSPTSSRSRT